jgi:hypothetical protein
VYRPPVLPSAARVFPVLSSSLRLASALSLRVVVGVPVGLALALPLAACATSLPLDPTFALHAEELPMKIRSGFWPNTPVVMGDHSFTNVAFRKHDAGVLELPGTTVKFGHDSFQLSFDRIENALLKNHIVCDGGPTADDPQVEVVRCRSDGGEGSSAGKEAQGRFVLDVTSPARGSLYTGKVTDFEGKPIWDLERAKVPEGKATSANVVGYVLRRGEIIEGTLDLTYLGLPRSWVMKELPANDRAIAVGVFAAVYFFQGKTESRKP